MEPSALCELLKTAFTAPDFTYTGLTGDNMTWDEKTHGALNSLSVLYLWRKGLPAGGSPFRENQRCVFENGQSMPT